MAEKEPVIVVKKITIAAAGGHGGSWKVAFADFMTAMMAFFLLMWLLGQSEDVKKNVSDYFSTPSVIEYEFSNYGVELTLEKIFLDLMNEPLKFFQEFMQPVDYTPNFMAMGSKKVVIHHMAEQLGDVATNVEVNSDEIVFEIPERHLFKSGTATTTAKFVEIMEKLKAVTAGLEDSNVFIDSTVYLNTVKGQSTAVGKNVAEERLDLVTKKIEVGLEHPTVDIYGKTNVSRPERAKDGRPLEGSVRLRIKQKDVLSDGRKPRPLDEIFGPGEEDMDVYQNFVKKITDNPTQK